MVGESHEISRPLSLIRDLLGCLHARGLVPPNIRAEFSSRGISDMTLDFIGLLSSIGPLNGVSIVCDGGICRAYLRKRGVKRDVLYTSSNIHHVIQALCEKKQNLTDIEGSREMIENFQILESMIDYVEDNLVLLRSAFMESIDARDEERWYSIHVEFHGKSSATSWSVEVYLMKDKDTSPVRISSLVRGNSSKPYSLSLGYFNKKTHESFNYLYEGEPNTIYDVARSMMSLMNKMISSSPGMGGINNEDG